MTETELADEIIRHALELKRLPGYDENPAAVKFFALADELHQQMNSRTGTDANLPKITALVKAADNARALVHSSIMTAANQARWDSLQKAFSRVSDGVQWLATLDSNTCPTCGALDGQVWDWDRKPIRGSTMEFRMPPRHWNCRCVLTPAAIDWTKEGFAQEVSDSRNNGGRASAGGFLKERMNFDEWLKLQPAEVVEGILGVEYAQAFLKGELTLTAIAQEIDASP